MEESDWTVPETTVLARLGDLLAAGTPAVLATVVDVRGSAYRRPGAKMVITPDGGVGSVTAGCLEDEIQGLAEDVLAAGGPRVETYDLMEDDDVWGLGVGCNGVIDVLLEPVAERHEALVRSVTDDGRVGVVTLLDAPEGSDAPAFGTATYRPGEGIETDGLPAWALDAIEDDVARVTAAGKSGVVERETGRGTVRAFIDVLSPPPELVVLGTGHDVRPVTELASANDFRVTVVGFRGGTATAERFPAADDVVSTSPARLTAACDFDERTYVVAMTHNFVDDRLALESLLETPVPYVGLLGPRKRFEEMQDEFAAEGTTFDSADLARIYTPVGLDLGGGSPYQIAHSIVAEVLAVCNDRSGGHLKLCEGPIHDRLRVE